MNEIKFSIIIPVYNDSNELWMTLDAIEKQTVPKDFYEVIVVDNGSIDDSPQIAQKFPSVQLLFENDYPGSPYSCRNRGVEIANGQIIVFLDSTCIPINTWLYELDKAFFENDPDMIGGRVSFRYRNLIPTASEYCDSITNINMKNSINNRGVAKTANLAVKKCVIESIGMFEEGIRSGGDVIWTNKAVAHGFRLIYCDDAEVLKKARTFRELIKKQWRVGKAQPSIWLSKGIEINYVKLLFAFLSSFIRAFVRFFLVVFRSIIKKLKVKEYNRLCKNEILGLAFIPSLIQVIMRAGNIYGYYSIRKQNY